MSAATGCGPGNLKLAKLSKENHNREAIHKAQHHRMRHKADEFTPMHETDDQLYQSHQDNGHKEVFDTVQSH